MSCKKLCRLARQPAGSPALVTRWYERQGYKGTTILVYSVGVLCVVVHK